MLELQFIHKILRKRIEISLLIYLKLIIIKLKLIN